MARIATRNADLNENKSRFSNPQPDSRLPRHCSRMRGLLATRMASWTLFLVELQLLVV